MTTLREAAEMALGTLQDVCARLLYRGVSKDPDHPDQIALEQARQTIRALKQATEQFRDPIAWNGWIVREVLFDEGEPVGHREHKPLTDEAIAALLSQSAGVDLKLNGGDLLFARAIERAHGIGSEE